MTACDRPWPRAAPVMKTTRSSSEPIPYSSGDDRQAAALRPSGQGARKVRHDRMLRRRFGIIQLFG
jgi:hypothetical protein